MGYNIDRPNRADGEGMKSFVSRIEALNREKESEKGSFMKRCATLNEDIKAVLDEAKGAGIPKASLKAVIKVRELERKVEAAREDLEDDDAAVFDDIREALGAFADLPLGAAAVAKAEAKPDATTAAIIAAVQKDEAEQAPAAAGEPVASPEEIEAQRKRDAEEFDRADAEKAASAPTADAGAADGEVSAKAMRANRTTRKPPVEKGRSTEPGHVSF